MTELVEEGEPLTGGLPEEERACVNIETPLLIP